MPRSFLVKKQQGSKKPNYGRLTAETDEAPRSTHEDPLLHRHHPSPGPQQRAPSLSCPLSLRASPPNIPPPSLLDRSPGEAPRPAAPCPQVNLDIQRVPGNYRRTDSVFPPSLPLLALFPAVPPGDGSQDGFECVDCRKECLSLPGLAEHKQLRCEWSSKKFFSCKFCEKEYVSLGALKMHIRTHTLPCVCKLCGKAFSRPWLLQGHIRTHTGEKPFSCLHCSRAFADRSNLRAHLQTHSEVKKYRCASCFKTFSRISLLAKHQEAGCPLS